MRINQEGLALLKRFEGFSATPYRCPGGVWTIGYGHTPGVTANSTPITESQAETLLEADISVTENAIACQVHAPLNSNQFSALVCLVFNIGAGNFKRSTLLTCLNKKNYHQAAAEFPRWIHANGRALNGLVARRAAEQILFLKG